MAPHQEEMLPRTRSGPVTSKSLVADDILWRGHRRGVSDKHALDPASHARKSQRCLEYEGDGARGSKPALLTACAGDFEDALD